ncbi:hypothetical protein M5K25_023419 [Dendrobium thyrsiflorum]|uniref:Uncharacterized protein n=1 Tax=Dendrobium thyrsiflorum TaxID=117978 RepID=A0ABD0UEX3_DENTH
MGLTCGCLAAVSRSKSREGNGRRGVGDVRKSTEAYWRIKASVVGLSGGGSGRSRLGVALDSAWSRAGGRRLAEVEVGRQLGLQIRRIWREGRL